MKPEIKENILSRLRAGPTLIHFEKKDGTIRAARATLNFDYIPEEAIPKGTGPVKTDEVQAFYDLDNVGWRSFRWDSIAIID
tara:strand:+ start:5860 stop:6105 length:246 start_codon:yes stop_codon:yes gene_type:complete